MDEEKKLIFKKIFMNLPSKIKKEDVFILTYSQDIKELVKERISVMPTNLKLSIGNYGSFNKTELLESVQREDAVGQEVIKMQLNFIRALTSGKFTEAMTNE